MCDKIPYLTSSQAHEELSAMHGAKFARKKIPKRVYYCKECQAFHLTSRMNKGKLPRYKRIKYKIAV